jgi:hypothetical protein
MHWIAQVRVATTDAAVHEYYLIPHSTQANVNVTVTDGADAILNTERHFIHPSRAQSIILKKLFASYHHM